MCLLMSSLVLDKGSSVLGSQLIFSMCVCAGKSC